MGYAIQESGTYRGVTEDLELFEGETYYEDVPQWAYDKLEADRVRSELVFTEDAWQLAEMTLISGQITSIEDEDPTALPGSVEEWRAYRVKVRAWKEGAQFFPDLMHRPIRPA